MGERGSVPTLLGAAAGVLVGCVVLFAVIGMVRNGGDTTPSVDDVAAPEASDDPADDTDDTADDGTDGDGTESEPPSEPEPEPTDATSEEPVDEPSEAEPAEDEPSEEPSEDDASDGDDGDRAVSPGDVTIQVLDATGDTSNTAASDVADELRSAGYNVVVVNRAAKTYDETTVFWSDGQEQAGRQIAEEFDFPQAEPTPEEVQLSDSVDVHVVVGTDQV